MHMQMDPGPDLLSDETPQANNKFPAPFAPINHSESRHSGTQNCTPICSWVPCHREYVAGIPVHQSQGHAAVSSHPPVSNAMPCVMLLSIHRSITSDISIERSLLERDSDMCSGLCSQGMAAVKGDPDSALVQGIAHDPTLSMLILHEQVRLCV